MSTPSPDLIKDSLSGHKHHVWLCAVLWLRRYATQTREEVEQRYKEYAIKHHCICFDIFKDLQVIDGRVQRRKQSLHWGSSKRFVYFSESSSTFAF